MKGKGWILVFTLLLLGALWGGLELWAEVPYTVSNGDFEGEFTSRGAGEVVIAEDWEPWYVGRRPEYQPETRDTGAGRVHEDYQAQKHFVVYSQHDAGIYQHQEGLTPGEWYTFQCYVYNWCSRQDDPDESVGGKCLSMVGVNPWGDAWPDHWTTIWGRAALDEYNTWIPVTVHFEAWSPRATLFTRGLGEWPVKHLDWYWDTCSLQPMDGSTPPEPPTATPAPTSAPVPTLPPSGECPSALEIWLIVEEVVAERAPVVWPR